MFRSPDEVRKDIRDAEARLGALLIELRDATVLVYVADYNSYTQDGSIHFVACDKEAKSGTLTCFLDPHTRHVHCVCDEQFVELVVDEGPGLMHVGYTHLRAFTSKEKAEECLVLWKSSHGQKDLP